MSFRVIIVNFSVTEEVTELLVKAIVNSALGINVSIVIVGL
jgi:hypothetical protein